MAARVAAIFSSTIDVYVNGNFECRSACDDPRRRRAGKNDIDNLSKVNNVEGDI